MSPLPLPVLVPAAGRHPLVDRLIAEGLPAADITLVTAGSGGAATGRHFALRERLQAMTGIGLGPSGGATALPDRHHLPATPDRPALSYLAAGTPVGRRVVFLHGTPGDATDWAPFLHRVPDGQHRLAVDRPGFGQSGPGAPVVTLPDQARAIAGLIARAGAPAVLVGSSYGGPVALQLAAEHPELVAGVLLVGAAADPARERVEAIQHLAARRGIARLLPRPLAHANAELLALARELADLAPRLGRIRAPVTILQGLSDTLVPPENAGYLASRIGAAARRRVVLVERAGHFLHLLRGSLVDAVLHQLVEDTAPGADPAQGRGRRNGAAPHAGQGWPPAARQDTPPPRQTATPDAQKGSKT